MRGAGASSPTQAAKPTGEFPVFLDYQDDVLRRRRAPRSATSSPQALTIAGKQEREAELDRVKALAVEKLAAAVRGPREGDRRRVPLADQEAGPRSGCCATRSASTAAASPTSGRCPPRSTCCPRVHGSALFERGETQILGVTTLNMLRMEQQLDTLSPGDAQALHAQLQLPAVLDR